MRCFTVLGPSQTGKTTVVDKLGSLEGTPKKSSSPHGLNLTEFTFLDEAWCALDAPGPIESLPHVQHALLASDACILCVSPVPEEAVLAAPYLRMIEASGTPCILFVNRMDEPRGRLRDVIAALQDYASHTLLLRQVPIREGDKIVGSCDLISERAWRYREGQTSALIEIPDSAVEREHEARAELLEHLSEFDDWLLEELVEDREPPSDALFAISARVLRENRIIPVMIGAASHNNGMMRLMKALRHEAPPVEMLRKRLAEAGAVVEDKLAAVSFHAYYRQNVGKTVLVRALGDGLRQGAPLAGSNLGMLQDIANGRSSTPMAPATGDVFAAVKSDNLRVPGLLTPDGAFDPPDWTEPPTPMIERILVPASERDETKLSEALAKLADTDRGLKVLQEEGTGAQLVCAQGPVHLRAVCKTLSDVFHITVSDRTPSPIYRETISKPADVHYRHRKQTGGAGQFAEVFLRIEPLARGAGFQFGDEVRGGAIPGQFIPAVEKGVREVLAYGAIAGYPVVDVRVVVYDGKHHSVDSKDIAFATAGRKAFMAAIREARPVVLEPIVQIEIAVPEHAVGDVTSDLSARRGLVTGTSGQGGGTVAIGGQVPEAELASYQSRLNAMTSGQGRYTIALSHYEAVPPAVQQALVSQYQVRDEE